jgi:hypothetical protein
MAVRQHRRYGGVFLRKAAMLKFKSQNFPEGR